MRLLLLLAGCTGTPGSGFSLPTVLSSLEGVYVGPEADAGFGTAVAAGAGRVVAGAPHGSRGRVYELRDGEAQLLLAGDGRLGAAVAVTPAGVVAGAPLDGVVLGENGQVVAEAPGAGLSLAVSDGAWFAATAEGWVSEAGTGPSPARPASLAVAGGTVAVGLPFGDRFVHLGDRSLLRPEEGAEAGYSMAAGDVDGDGAVEWVVGAPGARRVYVLGEDGRPEAVLEDGRLRFGHAVAVGDLDGDGMDELVVGAPLANGQAGWAGLYVGGRLVDTWTSAEAGSRLGWSVSLLADHIVLGAPGAPGTPGRVRVVRVVGVGN